MTLTLARKVLILVAVPLMFELGLVAGLAYLVNQAEKEREREAHAMAVTIRLDSLLRLLLERQSSNALRHMTGSNVYQKAFKGTARSMESEFKELMTLCMSDPKERAAIQEIAIYTKQADDNINAARHAQDNDDQILAMKSWIKVRNAVKKVYGIIDVALAHETQVQEQQSAEQARTRKGIEMLLLFGAIGNVALAIGLSLQFNRDTTDRLNKLMQNTVRLASDQPLHPQLRGEDEMATLDRFFRDMAKSLAEARRKERAVVDNANDIICSIDETGKFTAVNPASQALWGYAPEQLIGKRLSTIVPAEEADRVMNTLTRIVENQSDVTFDNRVLKPDGTISEMSWSVHWSAEEKSLFCVVHDVTERKKLEQMKRDLIAMVSHDLKTPLTSIQMVHSLLAANAYGELNEDGHESLEIADENVSRLIKLVNELLDIERIESGELELATELTSLEPIVESSIDAIKAIAAKKNVTVEPEPDNADPQIVLDKDRIEQVLINLLSNAIKFSNTGQAVTVAVSDEGEQVEVSVIDRGRGVPDELKEKIFERFKQADAVADRKAGGTGLGLAICKAIVERHGGQIGVQSSPGEGSRFWFRLPKDGAS